MLRGIERDNVERGRFAKPGSINPHTKFKAETYVLLKKKGEDTFFGNYRPQFYFRTTDVTGTVELLVELRWLCQEIILD